MRSAGTRDKWVGQPAHAEMVAAAAARGYDMRDHLGVHISRELLEWADVVLAMDGSNLAELRKLADERAAHKLALHLGDRDVPDPREKDADAFADVVSLIEDGAAQHLP